MKQTAVDWLVNEMRANDWWYLPASMKEDIISQAKEMEKAQITQSFVGGADFKEMAKNDNKRATAFADRYYRNNYK